MRTFDIESITGRIVNGLKFREQLKEEATGHGIELPVIDELVWKGDESTFEGKALRSVCCVKSIPISVP